jgi:hypothetical protein
LIFFFVSDERLPAMITQAVQEYNVENKTNYHAGDIITATSSATDSGTRFMVIIRLEQVNGAPYKLRFHAFVTADGTTTIKLIREPVPRNNKDRPTRDARKSNVHFE